MKKRNWILLGLAVLLVAGGGGFWFVKRADAGEESPYRTSVIRLGTVESTVTSTGILNAIQSVAIGTQVSGRVIELNADYNDRVREGQLLARIDPTLQEQAVRNSQASFERVQAALAQAEYTFNQNKTLFDNNVITETEFNQAQYNYTVAQSNLVSARVSLEQAQQNLKYTEIYAPIDGIVVERNVELGQTVAASLSAPQLYLLASDLGAMEILANVDESEIGQIQNGMPVRFTVQAYPNTTFEGTVRQTRLASVNSQNVVNYTAVISVRNQNNQLLPGMTASVDFIVQRAENVFLAPNAALRLRPSEEMIAELTDSAMIQIAQSSGRAGPGGPSGRAGGGMGAGGGTGAAGGTGAVVARAGAPGGSGAVGGSGAAAAANRAGGAIPEAVAGRQGGGGGQGRQGGLQSRQGGVPPEGFQGRGQGRGQGQGGQGFGGRQGGIPEAGAAAAAAGGAGAAAGAQTAPLTPFVLGGQRTATPARPTFAPLWYIKDGKLGVIRVQTGISDGTNTQITGEGIEEGMEIIIGLTVPEAANSATTNPFQQQNQFRGGGPGGIPAGGNFGGGGGGGRGGGGGGGGR